MPNRSSSTRRCRQTAPGRTFHPVVTTAEPYQSGYQQALADFAVAALLGCLKTYSDANFDTVWVALNAQEAETLAAILIQTLTATLNGKLLTAYVEAIRCQKIDASKPLSILQLPCPITDLPTTFPTVEHPRYLDGDRLRWLSDGEATDWGVAIGRFYSFAPHRCGWQWCYLLWLDPDSPSAAWITTDIAWEDDLEPLQAEVSR